MINKILFIMFSLLMVNVSFAGNPHTCRKMLRPGELLVVPKTKEKIFQPYSEASSEYKNNGLNTSMLLKAIINTVSMPYHYYNHSSYMEDREVGLLIDGDQNQRREVINKLVMGFLDEDFVENSYLMWDIVESIVKTRRLCPFDKEIEMFAGQGSSMPINLYRVITYDELISLIVSEMLVSYPGYEDHIILSD